MIVLVIVILVHLVVNNFHHLGSMWNKELEHPWSHIASYVVHMLPPIEKPDSLIKYAKGIFSYSSCP